MLTLNLKSGGAISLATVPKGTTLQSLVASQVQFLGRDDKEDPFYSVDLGRLLELRVVWQDCLPTVQPYYAVKCNSDPALLQTLASLGCGFDCASKAEIKCILDMGVSPDCIIYANPCKQTSHLKYACKKGVATLTFDNEVELHKVKAYFPTACLVLRIRADDPSALCQLGVKFGCTVEEGKRLLQCAREMELRVVGVSFHVGSNSKNPLVFLSALEMAHQLFVFAESLGYHFTLLDIGGGFPGTRDSGGFFAHLTDVVKEGLERYFTGRSELKIIAEPGRFFACSTHTLAVNIISKRRVSTATPETTPTFMYFVNDGVYGSFNCILYDHITPTPSIVKPPLGSELHSSSLWGPTCDGLDKICDVILPELEVSDWLYFDDMGAYTVCAASNFNGFTKPKTYYVVSEEMRHRFLHVWRSGVDSGEHLPPSLPPPPLPITPSHTSQQHSPSPLPSSPLATNRTHCHGNQAVQELVQVF